MSQLDILACFDGSEPNATAGGDLSLSAASIVSRTGLPRSTVFRLLRALAARDFVYQNRVNRRYTLGPRVLQLGLAAGLQLASEDIIAGPLLKLTKVTEESATFNIYQLPWRICRALVDGPHELRQIQYVGGRYPLHQGAAGKAILAHLSDQVVGSVLDFHGVPESAITTLRGELRRVRELGYSVSSGERVTALAGCAAPVFVGGKVYGSVGIAGPLERVVLDDGKFHDLVMNAARTLSDRLSA